MEWIKCSDRLPDRNNKYIVCLINNLPVLATVHSADISLSLEPSFYWPTEEWIKNRYYGEITHWIPLPDKPKD